EPYALAARTWWGPVRARAGTGHPDGLQDLLELRAVVPVSRGDDQQERFLPLVDRQKQLGGQSSARASKAVVVGLGVDAAGRLFLQRPSYAARRRARAMVESTLTSHVMRLFASVSACNCSKIRFQVPSRCQRRNRS
ncbi:hypothetical protein, partial [Streptomyces mirabilis]